MRKAMSILGAALLLPMAAQADDAAVKYYVTPEVGFGSFDSNRDLADEFGVLGLSVEKVLSEEWGVELRGLGASIEDEAPAAAGDEDVDFAALSASLVRYLPAKDKIAPYLTIGAGHATFNFDGAKANHDETQLSAGFGVRYNVDEKWSVRSDFRYVYGTDTEMNDGVFGLGLSYAIGGEAAPAAAPADTDRDGVADASDNCPSTPYGVSVDANGCAKDGDKDGVADYRDRCPNSAAGAKVDANGCEGKKGELVKVTVVVNFDFDSAEVKQAYAADLRRLVAFLQSNPGIGAKLVGHADATAGDDYNLALSKRRAAAVKAVLVNDYGIAADRVEIDAQGEAAPVASNDDKAGRAQNRRVEASAEGVVK